jgi:hypothetical protein
MTSLAHPHRNPNFERAWDKELPAKAKSYEVFRSSNRAYTSDALKKTKISCKSLGLAA